MRRDTRVVDIYMNEIEGTTNDILATLDGASEHERRLRMLAHPVLFSTPGAREIWIRERQLERFVERMNRR